MNELWRPVKGYYGLYEISTKGRLRSLDRKVTVIRTGTAEYTMTLKGRHIRPTEKASLVNLSKDGCVETISINTLYKNTFK